MSTHTNILQLRSRFVQNTILATLTLFPALVFVADRVMALRFTAIMGYSPDVYNYAGGSYDALIHCNQDPVFHLCSRLFASENRFTSAVLSLLATIAILFLGSAVLKQKRLALSLMLLFGGYILFLIGMQRTTPVAEYYIIRIGDDFATTAR